MTKTNTLYASIIAVSVDYLGPAAHRFVDRQIENHIKKSPQNLTEDDLDTFIDWTRIALSVLTEDRLLRHEYIGRLQSLSRKTV